MKIFKYILRTFGLITVRDAWKLLDESAEQQEALIKKGFPEFKDIPSKQRLRLIQSYSVQFSHYAQMCRNLKPKFYLLNAWWTK